MESYPSAKGERAHPTSRCRTTRLPPPLQHLPPPSQQPNLPLLAAAKLRVQQLRRRSSHLLHSSKASLAALQRALPPVTDVALRTRQKCDVYGIRLQQGSRGLADRVRHLYAKHVSSSSSSVFSLSSLSLSSPASRSSLALTPSLAGEGSACGLRCSSSLSLASSGRPRGPRPPPVGGLAQQWVDVSRIPTR